MLWGAGGPERGRSPIISAFCHHHCPSPGQSHQGRGCPVTCIARAPSGLGVRGPVQQASGSVLGVRGVGTYGRNTPDMPLSVIPCPSQRPTVRLAKGTVQVATFPQELWAFLSRRADAGETCTAHADSKPEGPEVCAGTRLPVCLCVHECVCHHLCVHVDVRTGARVSARIACMGV